MAADAAWLAPAVIVATVSLGVNGVKAAWDLYTAVRSHRNARAALRLQELNALLAIVQGMPVDDARKAAWRMQAVKLMKQDADVSLVYAQFAAMIDAVVGDAAGPDTRRLPADARPSPTGSAGR
jgi:hypothetical protein